ncbi:Predicted kinase [Lishizhenia tianjinensis]|uniref:Predicted kinase n=1 Tax=Lishizhenia tianjinensis TaxID=477690 RepID=A0A1I6X963_9FLAO|nr:ATP-binding protein [Lishizhenia tianjinensis]SFT34612.1 Predicted kinase [Lishizhenia tianjinensis]
MLHLIIGNTGAGKSSYAQKLKKEVGGVLFSIDEWNKVLFLEDKTSSHGLEWFLERIERGEKMIQSLIIQLEEYEVNAVLDLGFSKKAHRLKFIKFAKLHNFKIQLHYLDIDKATRWQRVKFRNINKGPTYQFKVNKAEFDFMETWFEELTPDELKKCVIFRG